MLLLALSCALRGVEGTRLAPEDPVMLGWRLVPGQELSYAFTTTHTVDDQSLVREEHWTYLVRDVDAEGVAYLEGRLTAFGVQGVEDADEAREAEEARLAEAPVGLSLAMDGRVVDLHGQSWGDQLVHRVLAVKLADVAVTVGDSWEDPAVVRPLVDVLPVGVDVALEASQTFEGLYARGGRVQARVRTRAALSADRAELPGIWVQGDAWWDLQAGQLASRTLELSLLGQDGGDPGVLTLEARQLR